MKNLVSLFLLVLLCCACEEDKSVDPTLMPPATTTGENTLGCLINGWVYTSGRFGKPDVQTHKEEGNLYITITTKVDAFSFLRLTLVNPRQGATCTYINACFEDWEQANGEAYITCMDATIISGTFDGGDIKEGRFDVRYNEVPEGEGNYE